MERLDETRVVYNIDDFPYKNLLEYKRVRGRKNLTYIQVPAAFDIETTSYYCQKLRTCPKMQEGKCPSSRTKRGKKPGCPNWIDPVSWMYHWQMCIGEDVVFGRTWEEYHLFLERVQQIMDLSDGLRLAVYVHNLAYEFSFMQHEFNFTETFARKKRKPIRTFDSDHGIEYRCSYFLTNLSLQKWTETAKGVLNKKEKESYDYNLIRYADTPLSKEEKLYCYRDVKGLCEALAEKYEEDTVAYIPMTSTGYVRRDCRKAVRANRKNITDMRKWRLSPFLYELMKEELRGGDTHANYHYAGEILDDLQTYDIASSYPFVAMSEKLPTKFIAEDPRELKRYTNNPDYGFIARFRFVNLRYIGKCGNPYVSFSKCRDTYDVTLDNGRLLAAKAAEITLNEIDYRILEHDYKWDEMYVKDLYVTRLKYLNIELREKILEYFKGKCTLKHVEQYMYMKSKNKLNGIYGMMITDILSDEIEYDGTWKEKPKNIEETLDGYYASYNSFLTYQHGIWIVAYARYNLRKLLWAVGPDVVYCDTDSVKCLDDHSAAVAALNAEIMQKIEKLDLKPIVEYNGETFVMGIWERDPDYKHFRTWGAKKYAVEYQNGEMEITVAGLSKELGSEEIAKKGLEEFKLGKSFFPSGRLTAFYRDEPYTGIFDGHEINVKSYVAMVPATYTLGITEDYRTLTNSDYAFWLDDDYFSVDSYDESMLQ